jgi:transcription elongation factor Elf1
MGNRQIVKPIYPTLTKLFPPDIIQTILQYADDVLIIDMQDYFPKLLQNITINSNTINKINKKNYLYVTKINMADSNISDGLIQQFPNLTKLNCSHCKNITDVSIRKLVNLRILRCCECHAITDASIQRLVNLTELYCAWNQNITDVAISRLVSLTELNCWGCPNITDASIQHLINLKFLNYDSSSNITDASIRLLNNLANDKKYSS